MIPDNCCSIYLRKGWRSTLSRLCRLRSIFAFMRWVSTLAAPCRENVLRHSSRFRFPVRVHMIWREQRHDPDPDRMIFCRCRFLCSDVKHRTENHVYSYSATLSPFSLPYSYNVSSSASSEILEFTGNSGASFSLMASPIRHRSR